MCLLIFIKCPRNCFLCERDCFIAYSYDRYYLNCPARKISYRSVCFVIFVYLIKRASVLFSNFYL